MSQCGAQASHKADFLLLQEYEATRSADAAARLFKMHEAVVRRACARFLRDSHLAEDATQVVLWLLLTRGPSNPNRPLAPWLLRAARLVCANMNRSYRAATIREHSAAAERPEVQEVHVQWEAAADLAAVLGRIDPFDRDLLRARHLLGRTTRDLSMELGISEQAVRKRLSRALRRARRTALALRKRERRESLFSESHESTGAT